MSIRTGRIRLQRPAVAQDPGGNKAVNCGRRGARPARREERAYREYVSDEQRSPAGCIGGHSGSLISARVLNVTMKEQTEREKAQENIAENRKAFHDFHLLETFEAGIMLLGTEAKAIREGRVNLRDSFARVENGEVFLYNVNISPYSHRGYADHEPLRRRKLLLHRDEIRKLIGKTVEKGMTLVPVRMYFKNGRVKVGVSLAKGKKDYDKRETIKRREIDRETRSAIKERRRR
jgi:SsrA-binding protein